MSIFPNLSRFHLKWFGLGFYILSFIPSYAAPESLWQHTYSADKADDFWQEATYDIPKDMRSSVIKRKQEIESLLARLGVQEEHISYHLWEIYLDPTTSSTNNTRSTTRTRNPTGGTRNTGNIPNADKLSFQLPPSVSSSTNGIRPYAVRIFWPKNLWLHPWDQISASGPTQPHRTSLPNNFLLRHYDPSHPNDNEQVNIGNFINNRGFTSIVFLPPSSGDAAPQILVIRVRIWRPSNAVENFIQKLRPRPKTEMADSGPHSDYLAVLRALKDLQSRDGSGEPKKFKTIPETFNVQHPNDEDLDLVYDLRKELQLPRMRALMTKHLKRLQDYVAKENPTSQDIVQLNDYQKQFAQQIKDCVIKTGIPRRYLDNLQGRIAQLHQDIDRASTQEEKDRLKQQGSGSFILRMGTNEQRKYESDIKAYAPEGDAAYQLNKNRDVSELAQIIGAPLLILGKIEETTAGGRIFPLEGDPQTYPNTPSGRPAVEGHLRNPSVLKIYRQDFGRSGVILSDPPPSPPPETGN